MSGPVLELLIFAGIALVIINKLIASFGRTSDDDPAKKSFFGENASSKLKDVTSSSNVNSQSFTPKFLNTKKVDLKGFIISENKDAIEEGFKDLIEKNSSFNIEKFLKGARGAFSMILEAAENNNDKQLEELVDKRYIEDFTSIAASYGNLKNTETELSAQVSEIYMFGNNAFIKVLFSGKNITSKITDLQEEWTFSRNVISSNPAWHLTNIDKPS